MVTDFMKEAVPISEVETKKKRSKGKVSLIVAHNEVAENARLRL